MASARHLRATIFGLILLPLTTGALVLIGTMPPSVVNIVVWLAIGPFYCKALALF
jgi:hypothetical protein